MSSSVAAIVGGGIGALVFLGVIVVLFFWLFRRQFHRLSNGNSDTVSPDQSAVVELERRSQDPSSSVAQRPHGLKQFRMEELEQATQNFDESNLIGFGSFGLVFKGLLRDGTIAGLAAIKRRTGFPRPEFIEEVSLMSRIWHRNVVSLLGFCQERGYQMLVYEYLPNGSMCNHLYGTRKDSATKLEFKQRLSIALGAAKGLCYLHSQQPPIIHSNFKTANVLVDENFIAKVADTGVSRLLQRIEDAGPSTTAKVKVFEDPEVSEHGTFSEMSDVYSFGVFLLELITGKEASTIDSLGSDGSILQWVNTHLSSEDLVDQRLVGSFTTEAMKNFLRLSLRCTSFPSRGRPKMETIVLELDSILEKEIMHTTVMGEGTATVTLGSQLFTLT